MSIEKRVLGIDYGSKMAGTTVVAYMAEGQVNFRASEKKRDADVLILRLADELKPDLIAIDAPLSLPGVYTGLPGCDDYFYRECDRLTRAMSPMFLGGLTARAMKLTARLRDSGIEVIEAYPMKAGKNLGLTDFGYRQKQPDQVKLFGLLYSKTGIDLRNQARLSGHHIDAAIALFIAQQYESGTANTLGNLNEGLIYY
ncbi:MAG: DUF429 domain-containing protein [Roseivirga sp.]|nr:DUF429 domain-containing protein [Roseivirga sp.]